MQHHPNYHYHHFNFITQPFFHFLLLLLLAVSHPHHISLVLSHPIPISESEGQLPSSKSNIIITQTPHPDPQLGVRAVQGSTSKKTIEGDSRHRNSDDVAKGKPEKELATEGIVSTWNDQILEWDDLTKCIRESEAGNAIERWLDCLESTSTLKPSDKIVGLEEVHPSGFRTGVGIGNGHVEVANDPLFEFTDKLKMEASMDSSASLRSSEEGFATIQEVEGSVSTENNEGAEGVADSEVGRFSKDDGFVLSLGQKDDDDDDDDSPESNFGGGGGAILGDRVSNVGVPVGLGLQEKRMGRNDLGFPGQVSGWVMQSDSSPGSTDPQALQNRMTNEGRTGSEVALDATESSTTTQNKRQNLMGAMKLAACLGVVVMLLWRKKNRLGISQESLVSEQMEEYPRPSATGFSMTARSASNTDIGYPDVKAGSLPAPLGMAIATVMAEVLAHEDSQSNLQSADELSKLLEAAMTESLAPVMGGECTGFVEQFKQSFRSTYRLIGSVRRASVKNLTHPSPARRNTKSPKFVGPSRREIRRLNEESDSFTTGISNVSRGNSSRDTGVGSGVQQFSSHVGANSESDLAEKFSKLTFSARNPKKEVGSTLIADMESPSSGIFQNLISSDEGQSRSANRELLSELGDASSSLRHGVSDDRLSDKSRSENILHGFETQIHENGATSRLGRSGSGFSHSGRESTSGLGFSHSQSGYGALNQATRSSLESFGGDLDLAIQPFGLTPPGQLVTTSEAEETMLSGLSHHGGGGGHLQHEMLLVLKQQNYLKSLELSYKLRGLSMKEENLHLTSEQNTLMRENVDLSRNKAEFKEAEFQDRKLVLAYTAFTRRCADELVAGLCVMLCALFFGAWNYSYSRLVDVVSTCQPYLHEQSNSMIPGMNKLINSLNMFTSQLHMFICEVTVASRMFFGLGVISIVAAALLRKSVSSNSQAMPATILIIILGGLCGIAGKFAVDSMGGSGRHWLLTWELFCAIHTAATCFTPFLYWVLNGTPPSTISSVATATGKGQRRKLHLVTIPPWLRRLVFHICMVLVLPVLAGLLPFATVQEIVRVFGSGFHNLVFLPIEVYLRERFHFSLL